MKKLVIECECHDTHHMMAFYHLIDDEDPVFDDFYVEVQLNQLLPWWKRSIAALCYVFGRRSMWSYGHWDEGTIGLEGAKQLREALGEYIVRREVRGEE